MGCNNVDGTARSRQVGLKLRHRYWVCAHDVRRASARLLPAAEQDPLPCIYCLAGLALGMGSEVLISGMWICIPVQGLLGQG